MLIKSLNIIQLVMEYCVLPLGSPVPENEEESYIKVQPVMFYGPEGIKSY